MLKIFCLVVATLTTIVVGKSVDIEGRVIGGYHVSIETHPYIVSIHSDDNEFLCAGTLISLSWVATIAHSVTHHTAEELYILSNSTSATEGVKTEVSTVEIYEDYEPSTLDHDIALLKLVEALSCLYCTPFKINKAPPSIGEMVTVIGWGQTSTTNSDNSYSALNLVEVPITNHEMCAETYEAAGKTILEDTICVGTNPGEVLGTCGGDQGGPVLTSEGLVGIVSVGDQCADDTYPGVYTKYEFYFAWIREISGVEPVG